MSKQSWVLGDARCGIDARPNFSGELLAIYLDGEKLRKTGKASATLDLWRPTVRATQGAQPELATWFLLRAAEAFAAADQWNETDAAYQEAIEKIAGAGSPAEAQALRGWCFTSQARGDWANAIKRCQAAAEENRKLGLELMVADVLVDMGRSLWWRDDLAGAEKAYSQALEIRQRLAPGSGSEAESLSSLGSMALEHGDFTKADHYYQQAIIIQKRIAPGSLDVAHSLVALGNVARGRGDLVRAEQSYRQALAIGEKLFPDSMFVAATMTNMGFVARDRGDLDQAEAYYRRGLALWEKRAPGTLLVAASFNYLGSVALDRGAPDQAEKYYQQALAIQQKEAPGGRQVAWTFGNLGQVAQSRGDLKKAEEFYTQALAVEQKVAPDNLGVAKILNNLGSLARKREDFAKAEEYYRQALTIWEKAAPEKQEYGDTLATLATVMVRQEQFGQAIPLFEHALTVQESQMAHLGGEEETRSRFRALHAADYQGYVDLLIRQKQTKQAFQVLERSRERTLLEVLGSHRTNITKAMTDEEREKEANLQTQLISLNRQLRVERSSAKPDAARLAALNSDLEKAQSQYSDFQAALYLAHPELQAQRGQIQPVSLDEAAALLPDKRCAVLEFMVAEEKTYLFVLTPSTNGNVSQPELNVYSIDVQSKDLAHDAEQFRRQLAQRDLRFGEAAKRLYRLLLRPAQPQLSQADALLIVPDGPLWNLPFQALEPRPGHYLLEDHAVAYASSLTILREMVRLRLRNSNTTRNSATADPPANTGAAADPVSATLLAMGNPILGTATAEVAKMTYRDGTLAPLPDAAREVKTLQDVYGRQQSRVFVGMAASEEQFKAHAGAFRILHLATHGFLNDTSPMYSHLLLSPGNDKKEDGLLQTWEIMNLNLHADLAVLSACETARGRVTTGEGVIGLAWAFFVAGVPTTIVSQWSVESGSTARLMIAFHRERKITEKSADPFGTARALQRAELKLLHSPKYSAPFYWAGFITLGDPR
jgi:CHAT domain-containing protein